MQIAGAGGAVLEASYAAGCAATPLLCHKHCG